MSALPTSLRRLRWTSVLLFALAIGLCSATQTHAQPNFDLPTVYSVAIRSMALATGDTNGDNFPELFKVSEFREAGFTGCGDGNFCGGGAGYNGVAGPRDIIAGNLTNNGSISTVSITYESGEIHIYLPSYAEGQQHRYYFIPYPMSVAIGEVNGDNFEDIIVISGSSSNGEISVLLNQGDGTFTLAPTQTNPINGNSQKIVFGKFGPEGALGIAAASEVNNNVAIYLPFYSEGMVSWNEITRVGVGAQPVAIATIDINNDGYDDFVTANKSGGSISYALNAGDGTFNGSINVAIGLEPVALAVGLVNNDAHPDVVVGCASGKQIQTLRNNQVGGFFPAIVQATEYPVRALALAKFNSDANLDLAVAQDDGYDATIYAGNGAGSFTLLTRPSFGWNNAYPLLGDLDGDGDNDVVTISSNSVATVSLNSGGAFDPPTYIPLGSLPSAEGRCAALTDIDGDGDLDLIVVGFYHALRVLLNDGTGYFSDWRYFNTTVDIKWMALADVNGDGKQDVVAVGREDARINILLGDGAGEFTDAGTVAISPGAFDIEVGDFNRDGVPDLALANAENNRVDLWRGTGGGGFFAAAGSVPVGFFPRHITTLDIDNDGNLDLAVANTNSGTISVLRGSGDLTFDTAIDYPTDFAPTWVTAQDVDFDGQLDLLTAHPYAGNLGVLHGQSGGGFSAWQSFTAGVSPGTLAMGDVDGDGLPDAITGNWFQEQFNVLRNAVFLDTVSVSGNLTFGGLNLEAPVQKVSFAFRPIEGNAPFVVTAMVAPDGYFELPRVPMNNYSLRITAPKYLATAQNVDTTFGSVFELGAFLRPGDVVGDQVVDLFDLVALFNSYGAMNGDPEWNPLADFTGDDIVDLFDLVIIFDYYGEEGDL